MSPTKHLKIDENGRTKFKQCKKCNRPTLGHDDDGYGKNVCNYTDKVDDEVASTIYEEIKSRRNMRNIIEKITIDEMRPCEECSIEFEMNEDLEEHMEEYHNGLERSGCKECEEDYKSGYELEIHMITVHRYICPECGMYFGCKGGFNRHERECDITEVENTSGANIMTEETKKTNEEVRKMLQQMEKEQRKSEDVTLEKKDVERDEKDLKYLEGDRREEKEEKIKQPKEEGLTKEKLEESDEEDRVEKEEEGEGIGKETYGDVG